MRSKVTFIFCQMLYKKFFLDYTKHKKVMSAAIGILYLTSINKTSRASS